MFDRRTRDCILGIRTVIQSDKAEVFGVFVACLGFLKVGKLGVSSSTLSKSIFSTGFVVCVVILVLLPKVTRT